jgi:hypothetical protein
MDSFDAKAELMILAGFAHKRETIPHQFITIQLWAFHVFVGLECKYIEKEIG